MNSSIGASVQAYKLLMKEKQLKPFSAARSVEWGILTSITGVAEFVNANGRQLRNPRAFHGWRKIWGIVADSGPNIQAALVHMWQEIYDESPIH